MRTIIVTGAGHGLGEACAMTLAKQGAAVVINDLDAERADAVAERISRAGGRAVPVAASVATKAGVEQIIDTAVSMFGGLDAVVSNAGIFRQIDLEDETVEGFRQMVDVHLTAGFLLAQRAHEHLRRSPAGRFVAMVSGAGLFGQSRMLAYSAAKGGLAGLVRTLAIDWEADGILVNGVAPVAQTGEPRTAEGRTLAGMLGERRGPEWAASLIAHLAQPECSVTGRFYASGGGRAARIFTAESTGWTAPEGPPPTTADIAAHWEDINASERFEIPLRVDDSLALLARELRRS